MRTLVGIIVEAKNDGTILPTICQFPIENETAKMIYIDTRVLSFIHRRSIRSLSHINKNSLGKLSQDKYSASFHFQIHDVVENNEQVNALVEKIKSATEEELRKRVLVNKEWEQSFMHLHLDMEVK